ncbi:MAG TPA: DUF192 domain-containing protein [Terriglobales bacterium]|jgi:hypothetical protein|nr:DUF192 domain-containing protein [Terriglobales bacterium]
MPVPGPTGFAFNRTRRSYLATELRVAETHWSRFRGLMMSDRSTFGEGQGLWIVPSHGVHTFAMRFPIDVVYLNADKIVVYMKQNLQPWRVAAVRHQAASVLELPGSALGPTGTSVGDEIEIVLGKKAAEVAS